MSFQKHTQDTPSAHTDTPVSGSVPRNNAPHTAHEGQHFFTEIVKFALLALVIVLPFRMFIAQPFIVSGASMSPTFETSQYLIVDKASYHFSEPHRGDVIVFRFPNDTSKRFIKRVIGLPGEIVRIQNNTVSIVHPTTGESLLLEEAYLPKNTQTRSGTATVLLGSDEYFVMGDNRSASSDSRDWGPVPRTEIIGRAYLRLFPPTQFSILPGAHVTQFTEDMVTNNNI